ncbi:LysM peptidoglycan-binding domain-containing protein [Chryseomicrobium palamuruense]|uniref:LysM peptidoglycan-binding domain-containing protein n=1 Tax=Chryseomicrobium palamuruense TaxID=682973 RepID=A0ABV8UVR4_9BACL
MANNDYQKKLDEHRKEIGDGSTISRRSRQKKKVKKKQATGSRSYFLPTLFTIGIILPIFLLAYAYFFYEPAANESPDNQQVVQLDVQPVTPPVDEEEESQEEPAEEVEPEPEPEPVEEEQEEQQPEVQEPEVQEPVAQPSQPENSRTHTVQPQETLYRIAMNYYNDASAVERIKAANNLSSNEIRVGQVLILP